MNRRGVTLIELLMTLIIVAVAMFALVPPFVGERAFFQSGKAQAESQRDAEMVMRAIARVARESNTYAWDAGQRQLSFTVPTPSTVPGCSLGGTAVFELHDNGEFHLHDCNGNTAILIDGGRSQVTHFLAETITSKLVQIQLDVTHRTILTSTRIENESLVTEIFLRNAS